MRAPPNHVDIDLAHDLPLQGEGLLVGFLLERELLRCEIQDVDSCSEGGGPIPILEPRT